VAGSKRERELARAKYERQSTKRAASDRQRRQRLQMTTAVVVGALVVVGVVFLARALPSASGTPAAGSSGSSGSSANVAGASCEYRPKASPARQVTSPPTTGPTTPPTSTMDLVVNGKAVTVELLRSKAPCTVNSFVSLANQKYFDKTPCHRLTSGSLSVLQCGDPTGTGSGGPGYDFSDENLVGATYPAGTVAMANSGPNTNGSQFFIVYKDSSLPPDYAPFGKVVAGLDVIKAIAAKGVKGGGTDGAPAKPVTIDRVVPAG
jgi:peptidyl-prolyl cis-trans isomerase B (cyclophilin B)